MKIQILDLEFSSDYFYIQNKSIVEKILFNNRTFYSKFEKIEKSLTPILTKQHYNNEISLAVPLIEKENNVNYLVIEYKQEDWSSFYSLLKYLFKTLHIDHFSSYFNSKTSLFQIFIPRDNIHLDVAYNEVENIKHLLDTRSKKSYKIYPNKFLPKNYNIITLPVQKV